MTTIDLSAIEGRTIEKGAHSSPSGALCIMEAAALVAGEPHTDHPQCVREDIASACRAANDLGPQWLRDALLERLPLIVGTAGPTPDGVRYLWADLAVRRLAPIALRVAGLERDADTLAGLSPVVDRSTARAAADAAADAARATRSDQPWRLWLETLDAVLGAER